MNIQAIGKLTFYEACYAQTEFVPRSYFWRIIDAAGFDGREDVDLECRTYIWRLARSA